jgi:type III pantothenate kinase
MNLVIDIGNTRTKYGIFDRDILVSTYSELSSERRPPDEIASRFYDNIIIANSGKLDKLEIYKSLSHNLVVMDGLTKLPISLKHKTPESLGQDRKAACVGANTLFPDRTCLVFDAGTALTIDLLHPVKGMIGGNISPGLKLRFHALHNFTAALPLLSIEESKSTLGDSTHTSIVNGVQQGIIFEVDAYIRKYQEQYADLLPIFTGGDAVFFVKNLKSSIFVQPDLVIIGLNRILKYYAK